MGREGLKKELKKKRFSREFKSQRYRLKKIYHTKTLSRPFNKQHENKFHRIQPVPRSKSHHPPGCRCEWASPNLRIGAAIPASHRCRLQRVPKNYSPSNRRGCVLHDSSSTLPSFTEREREWKTKRGDSCLRQHVWRWRIGGGVVSTATCRKAGHVRTHVLGIRFAGT